MRREFLSGVFSLATLLFSGIWPFILIYLYHTFITSHLGQLGYIGNQVRDRPSVLFYLLPLTLTMYLRRYVDKLQLAYCWTMVHRQLVHFWKCQRSVKQFLDIRYVFYMSVHTHIREME